MRPSTQTGESNKKGGDKRNYAKQHSEAMGAKQGQMLKSGADDDFTQDKFLMGSSSGTKQSGTK
jgi:hypothetical protein